MNNVYINFSADNSNTDSWVAEMLNYYKVSLEKICSYPIQVNSGLDNTNYNQRLKQADVIVLVFNGFVSDEFSKDLKELELNHQDFINSGKEIFVVVKSGKFSSIIPVYLRRYSQLTFFEVNVRTNEIIEYTPFLKGEKENKFWSKLTDLTYDTKMFIDRLNGGDDSSKKLTIFLAEVSKDQIANREILKREFLLSGYNVFPSKPLPASVKEYQDTATEIIKTADLSIHIMGDVYGESPSGTDYSYPEIQNKIVTYLLTQPGELKENFYRYVWLPPTLEPYDERQIQFLKRLKRELAENSSGEIIQCSIEEFKDIIVQKINQLTGSPRPVTIFREEGKLVFITDSSQQGIYQKIEKQLKLTNKNFDVIDLSQSGDLLPLAMFRQKLRLASAAVLLNTSGNINWMQGILGLTIKNLNSEKKTNKKFIAAISSNKAKAAIDFEALKVDFFSAEDGHLAENLEKFLIQE